MTQSLLKIFCLGFVVFCLSRCSFDPKLDDLKLRVAVKDLDTRGPQSEFRITNLSYWHCCRFYFSYQNGQESPQQDSTLYPVKKPNGKGEFTVLLPTSLLANRRIQFNLNCAHKSNPSITYTETVSNCESLDSEINICNGQFSSGSAQQILVEVPSSAQLGGACVVK